MGVNYGIYCGFGGSPFPFGLLNKPPDPATCTTG